MPEPKTFFVDVPGTDDGMDLTQSLTGDVCYKRRGIDMLFTALCSDGRAASLRSDIADALHGRETRIVFDHDPSYYYSARTSLDGMRSLPEGKIFSLSASALPYKYERFSSLEDWEWDSFCFEDGIIREYAGLAVAGELELVIPGRRMRVSPAIEVSGNVSLTYRGETRQLSDGRNEMPDLVLGEGENVLLFTGNGVVSVDYRGGRL